LEIDASLLTFEAGWNGRRLERSFLSGVREWRDSINLEGVEK
jgi:hypothetical protein